MAITEDKRNELHNALNEALGREEATTLMEHLPPVGWADVATKQDLAHLEARIDAKLERELREQMNRFYLANSIMLGIVVAVMSLVQILVASFS